MPKSAKEIVRVLLSSSSILTQKDLMYKTGLSIRSVKGSLVLLKKRGFVEELVVLQDMRCKTYRLGGVIHER